MIDRRGDERTTWFQRPVEGPPRLSSVPSFPDHHGRLASQRGDGVTTTG